MLVDMVLRYMPNSGHGGPLGTGVMTIFGSYVDRRFPIFNILMYVEYMKVYKSYLDVYTSI